MSRNPRRNMRSRNLRTRVDQSRPVRHLRHITQAVLSPSGHSRLLLPPRTAPRQTSRTTTSRKKRQSRIPACPPRTCRIPRRDTAITQRLLTMLSRMLAPLAATARRRRNPAQVEARMRQRRPTIPERATVQRPRIVLAPTRPLHHSTTRRRPRPTTAAEAAARIIPAAVEAEDRFRRVVDIAQEATATDFLSAL